jgi:hypothetical protein
MIGIGTVGGVVQTQHGPVIVIMHQYALLGKGASIHSPSITCGSCQGTTIFKRS